MNLSIIVIDEGHALSGPDYGADYNGISESKETRSFGALVEKYCKEKKVTVDKCTIDYANSVGDSITKRLAIANQRPHDLLLIIHFNAFGQSSAYGCELFILPNNNGNYSSTAAFNKNKVYGEEILEAVCKAGGFFKRGNGVKYRDDLGMLLNSRDYAVYLEVCFISNKSDVDRYKANKDKIAKAIATAISGKAFEETKPVEPNKPEEVVKHMNYCVTYCNEVDREAAEMLGKLLMCHVMDARIATNWRNMADTLIAVGGDNPNKGKDGQVGFSGYTNIFLKGADRKETAALCTEYARNR